MCPSILGGSGGGAHLHHPQSVSFYLGWWWGRGSFASSTECVPLSWVEMGEGLICIIHRMCPSILGGGGGGAHLHHPQSVSFCLSWVVVGEGLICIIHRVCPSVLGGGGGAHLHHPQSVSLSLSWVVVWEGLTCIIHRVCPSLYFEWWWGRGSFASSTVCILLSWVEVGEGLIGIIHRICPSILGGGGGGAHLHHPQNVSLHLGWW